MGWLAARKLELFERQFHSPSSARRTECEHYATLVDRQGYLNHLEELEGRALSVLPLTSWDRDGNAADASPAATVIVRVDPERCATLCRLRGGTHHTTTMGLTTICPCSVRAAAPWRRLRMSRST